MASSPGRETDQMSDVKWVKLMVDMFDNRKIRHLRRLPEGNNIVLIWVMLLTMAGRCNAGGMIFLTENIPYNAKMLADELDFEESTVRLALEALERLNMISTAGDLLMISGWQEHQNIEGMEKIREQNRLRQKKWYDKQKALPNVSPNVTLTQPNATEEDKEEEKEVEEEKESKGRAKRFTPPTLEEVEAYCRERGNSVDPERFLDYYTSNGWKVGKNTMKDWKAAVRTWEKSDKQQGRKDNGFQTSNPFLEMLQEERGL